MSISTAFDILNVLLGIAGIGIGVSSVVYNSQIQHIQKQMKKLYKQNQALMAQSDTLQEQLGILVKPQLVIANSRVQLALKNNLAQVQLYYKYVGQLMKDHNGKKYHAIMERLKSAQSVVLSPSRLGMMAIGGLANIMWTIHGTTKISKEYKRWKRTYQLQGAPQIPLNDLLQNPSSSLSEVVQQSSDAIFVVRGSVQGPATIPVISSIQDTQARSNSGSFRIFLRQQFTFHKNTFKESFNSFNKILSAIGSVAGLVTTGLQIKNLIETSKNLDDVRQNLIEFENSLKSFRQTCLGVLYDMQTYLATFQAQIFSFAAFINYVQLICTHNMLQIKYTNTQIQNQFAKYIEKLNMNQEITPSTFQAIRQGKSKTKKALEGFKVQKKPSTDPTKKYQYTTNQSNQKLQATFKQVTDIFTEMEKAVKLTVIYDKFYQKLLLSQEIIPKLSYRDSKDYAKFANIVKRAIQKKQPLQQIEQLYSYQYDIEVHNFTKQDRFEIAQLISFFTDTYPGNQPKVYGYTLKDFSLQFDPDLPFTLDKQIYDLDLSNIMGTWPNIKKQQSINQIYNKYKIDKEKLKYKSSSMYMKPPKQLAPYQQSQSQSQQQAQAQAQSQSQTQTQQQKGPKYDDLIYQYTLYRVQVFELGKQSYYVLYDGVTNMFKSVELTLLNIDQDK